MIERIMADTAEGTYPGFIVEDDDVHFIVSALSPKMTEHSGKPMTAGATLIPQGTLMSTMVVHVVQLIREFCGNNRITPDEFMMALDELVNTNKLIRPKE